MFTRTLVVMTVLAALGGCGKKQAPEASGASAPQGDSIQARLAALDPQQTAALDLGNELMAQGRMEEARAAFRRGIEAGGDPLIFQAQVALTYIEEDRPAEAKRVLAPMVRDYPREAGINWYWAIATFTQGDDPRGAIKAFVHAKCLIPEGSPQHVAADWFIGDAYRQLLTTEGLLQADIDRMFAAYQRFIDASPPEDPEIQQLVIQLELIRAQRPPPNVARWALVPDPAAAEEALMKFMEVDDEDSGDEPVIGD